MDIDAVLESGSHLYQTWIPDYDLKFSYRILSIKEYKVFQALRDGGVLSEEDVADKAFEEMLPR